MESRIATAKAAMQDEDATESPHVVVAVRLRPLNEAELSESCRKVVAPDGNKLVFAYKGQDHTFKFDHVLGDDSHQVAVFQLLGKPQVEKAFDGYNSTIFAYGQTGSGKTFTMLNVRGLPKDIGLIPRISEALFAQLAETSRSNSTSRFLVQCSFLEIYNEVIYDLLVPRGRDSKGKGLEIREQKGLGVYVKDLTEEVVTDADQLDRLIHEGFAQRTTSATAMNDASSRSHCVFTICLHCQDTSDSSRNTISKLHLVDLAGSEKSGSDERKQAKENANINKSLSALGNVINALSSSGASRRKAFVPFRDSKLTRVLQESFSGNAFCTMIATVSPAEANSEETFSTLQYAKRAKTIRVAATRNEESKQRQELLKEVEELRKFALEASSTEELEARHKAEIEALEAFMKETWEDKQRLSKEQEEQREMAKKEVERANEQRLAEQKRRLDALAKLGDLSVTLQSLVALDTGELSWPERLASVLRIPQQLLSRQQGMRLYRDGAEADVKELLGAQDSGDATSSLLLNQAAEKLKLMAKELPALKAAQKDYKSQLCAISVEVAISLKEAEEEEVDVERLQLLKLVQTQLGHHYASTSEQFFNEVASLDFLYFKEVAERSDYRQECERVQAALEDLQEQMAIVCDERDVARNHEEELFYVIRKKDEELFRALSSLANLTEQVEEGKLVGETAELLGNENQRMQDYCAEVEAQNNELRAERVRYEEVYSRCTELEAEVAELRAEGERASRKREKLAKEKQELKEKLKVSEQFRQAARDQVEQLVMKKNQKGDSDDATLEDLAKSMDDQQRTKQQRSLQRSRTVGAIGGSGAAAAEAIASMRAEKEARALGNGDLGSNATVLPVFGMTDVGEIRRTSHGLLETPLGDGSGHSSARSGRSGRSGRSVRSTVSGPVVTEVQATMKTMESPSFGAREDTATRTSTHSGGRSPKPSLRDSQ